jgi:hypothetical protein
LKSEGNKITKIKIEIDSALLKEIKEILKETFDIEKTERKTLGRRIRTAFLVNDKMEPSEIIEIVLKDYLRILKRLYY